MMKNRGFIFVVVGSLFLLAVAGILVSGFGRAQVEEPSIAVIDVDKVFERHPMYEEAVMAIQMEQFMIQQEYSEKMEELTQEELYYLEMELDSRMSQLQHEWIAKIENSIMKVVDKVAEAEGYDIVLIHQVVMYGGIDITETVISQLPEAEVPDIDEFDIEGEPEEEILDDSLIENGIGDELVE